LTEGVGKSKRGRPRVSDYLRKELWEARRVAREAYKTWEKNGAPERVSQKQFSLDARILIEDQARLNKWFPMILVSKKPHQWNLSLLGPILRRDDPVVMIMEMISVDPVNEIRWWKILEDVELQSYTQMQEEFIREAYLKFQKRMAEIGATMLVVAGDYVRKDGELMLVLKVDEELGSIYTEDGGSMSVDELGPDDVILPFGRRPAELGRLHWNNWMHKHRVMLES